LQQTAAPTVGCAALRQTRAAALDGAGIYGTPDVPCNDFRAFAVDDANRPLTMLDELHESLGWTDLKTEMRLSREAAAQRG
jgi:hypothetical protein